nr:MAG TPA: Cytochrome oxidase maturation protein cbb3-type [Caudoviricetes sp.]
MFSFLTSFNLYIVLSFFVLFIYSFKNTQFTHNIL